MCTLNWQLLSCTVSHPILPHLFATILPPLFCAPRSPELPLASCSSLEGLSWSKPIKLQWEAAWRKHGSSVALLSVNYMIPAPDSGGPISFSNSPADLWPHVGHSQTHKITLHTHRLPLTHRRSAHRHTRIKVIHKQNHIILTDISNTHTLCCH